MTVLAGRDEVVVSGRLSTSTQGWLAGHAVNDSVVFPATGFIEVVLRAGELAGCPVIDELVVQTPLVLVEDTPTDLQITVAPLDVNERRAFSVHARTGGQHGRTAWMLHASGTLSAQQHAVVTPPLVLAGIEPIDEDSFYGQLGARGYRYSGPFCSLRAVGSDPSHPEIVYAQVVLPADTEVSGYGIHPALLDAALHSLAAVFFDGAAFGSDSKVLRLPFAFTGISLYASAATRLHVQLVAIGADTFTLHATDPTGAPVISIGAVTLRALSEHLGRPVSVAGPREGLLELAWSPVPETTSAVQVPTAAALSGWAVCTEQPECLASVLHAGSGAPRSGSPGSGPPRLVIWALPLPERGRAGRRSCVRVHTLTRHTLAGLQSWLARPETSVPTW